MIEAVLEVSKNGVKFEADPLVSMIVPVYDVPPMVFKRCLMSLADQDYENKEVILVFDGPNKELLNIANGYDFTIIEIEHSGACAARNAGFKDSKGEIVSFFNSDYIAKPGMIRLWVDALKNNPEYGFVYGGYEYNVSHRQIYPSKPFDEFQLDVANYIDCGFLLWRKYVVEWDPICKSLQDWDFWLRVVKTHKVKGFFLGRDYSFIAEPPRPKGLSDDSSSHWIDRVNYIKTKNGIKKSDVLVTSLGAPNHAVEIAKMIGADWREDTIYKPSEYKSMLMVGFYITPGEQGLNEHARILAHFKDKYPDCKRIVYFVGADIHMLESFPYKSLKYLSGALRMSCDHILSENQSAHDELLQYGIPSEIVPIPSYISGWEVKPLPKDFKVSIYLVEPGYGLGQSSFDKYNYEACLSIIRGMPDVKFTAYGYGGRDLKYPNLKHMGIIPKDKWKSYVEDNSCLLRLVKHDTKPLASNEFMLAGRDVISNIQGECTDYIDTSGNMELNEWDKFEEGFNSTHWPETKANVIRKIREIRKRKVEESVRKELHDKLFIMQDHKTFIDKIHDLCGTIR